jgi:hypothetical protein
MNLQMQLRRGVIALVIGLVVCGAALARAGAADALGARAVDAMVHAAHQTVTDCDASLRIELAGSVHVTVPCDLACAPMRSVLHTLHVSATRLTRCGAVHTA